MRTIYHLETKKDNHIIVKFSENWKVKHISLFCIYVHGHVVTISSHNLSGTGMTGLKFYDIYVNINVYTIIPINLIQICFRIMTIFGAKSLQIAIPTLLRYFVN